MNFQEKIEEGYYEFIKQFKVSPKAMYLGQFQIDLLSKIMTNFPLVKTDYVRAKEKRAEYMGMKIYKVDSKNYC